RDIIRPIARFSPTPLQIGKEIFTSRGQKLKNAEAKKLIVYHAYFLVSLQTDRNGRSRRSFLFKAEMVWMVMVWQRVVCPPSHRMGRCLWPGRKTVFYTWIGHLMAETFGLPTTLP